MANFKSVSRVWHIVRRSSTLYIHRQGAEGVNEMHVCLQGGKGISLWCTYTIKYFLKIFAKASKIIFLSKGRHGMFIDIPVLLFCGKFKLQTTFYQILIITLWKAPWAGSNGILVCLFICLYLFTTCNIFAWLQLLFHNLIFCSILITLLNHSFIHFCVGVYVSFVLSFSRVFVTNCTIYFLNFFHHHQSSGWVFLYVLQER